MENVLALDPGLARFYCGCIQTYRRCYLPINSKSACKFPITNWPSHVTEKVRFKLTRSPTHCWKLHHQKLVKYTWCSWLAWPTGAGLDGARSLTDFAAMLQSHWDMEQQRFVNRALILCISYYWPISSVDFRTVCNLDTFALATPNLFQFVLHNLSQFVGTCFPKSVQCNFFATSYIWFLSQ